MWRSKRLDVRTVSGVAAWCFPDYLVGKRTHPILQTFQCGGYSKSDMHSNRYLRCFETAVRGTDVSMKISQPRSFIASIVLGFFFAVAFVGAITFNIAGSRELIPLKVSGVAWVILIYCEFIRDSRSIRFDLNSKCVIEQFRSWRGLVKTNIYPLEQFGSVVSYVTPFRHSRNLVELVTRAGGESLCLVAFQPASAATSFWSIPKECESPKAEALRKTVSGVLKLQDKGFLGVRWPGAYVSPISILR